MEFMDGGSLTQVLDQYKYLKLSEEQCALIMGEAWTQFQGLCSSQLGLSRIGLLASNASYSQRY